MKQCSPQQMKSIQEQQTQQHRSIDTTQTHGCVPHSNSAFAEDHGLSSSGPQSAGILDFITPGDYTTGGLDAVADWIENGTDGKKDGQWTQLGRAVPGAVGMGLAMIGGGALDIMDTAWGMTPFGD